MKQIKLLIENVEQTLVSFELSGGDNTVAIVLLKSFLESLKRIKQPDLDSDEFKVLITEYVLFSQTNNPNRKKKFEEIKTFLNQ